ncbi:MAG TPA: MFS transporter [Acidimicrobiales bacterium]|jgi:EmrB/QacA subfamily drug resistance transporter|nr:MFS transporter [Acidimicrobiales bacterium]
MTKLDPAPEAPTVPAARFRGIAPVRRLSSLPVLMCGVFIIVLDFFVVNVALPSMQADLHAGASAIEWVIAGYGLTFAVFLIAAGRLGDMIGRRLTFAIGLALFVLASAGCGLAPNPTVLVVARLAQGVAAAFISPNVLAIMGVAFPGAARVRAITVYGMVMGLAAAGGQLIGGILIQANLFGWGWRTVFLINVPVGLVALAFTRRLVPESRVDHPGRIDVGGNVLAVLGMTALVLPLVEGTQLHWPAWTWVSLAAAPAVFTAFALHQQRLSQRGGTPLLDPALFRQRALLSGLGTQLVFWCGQASFFLVLALYLQKGRGLDALQAGLVFSILALAYLATSMRAPGLTLRFGRSLIAMGAITLAVGDIALLAAAHGAAGSIGLLAPGLVLVGAGMGLCITPLTTTVLAHADGERAGAVSGALATMQQVGNAVGLAVTGVIFFGALSSGYQRAFELALVELAALLLAVAALTRLLPRTRADR